MEGSVLSICLSALALFLSGCHCACRRGGSWVFEYDQEK
jgi:hypothetical protein